MSIKESNSQRLIFHDYRNAFLHITTRTATNLLFSKSMESAGKPGNTVVFICNSYSFQQIFDLATISYYFLSLSR